MKLLTSLTAPWIAAWLTISLVIALQLNKTQSYYSLGIIIYWAIVSSVLLFIEKCILYLLLRLLRVRGSNYRTFAVVGPNKNANVLLDKIQFMQWAGLKFDGLFECAESLLEATKTSFHDYIFICHDAKDEGAIIEAINTLSATTSSIYYVPIFFNLNSAENNLSMFGNIPIIKISDPPLYGFNSFIKRSEDIILSTLILLIISPLLILISLLIKLDSRGPVFFIQKRHGLNGRIIHILKFRTMIAGSELNKVDQVKGDDPRLTRIGKILRRNSLDELPQFINVIKGEMSIVGPRPHPILLNEYFKPIIKNFMSRHKVKPGITGLAQINGFRGSTDTTEIMQQRIDYDLLYINNWSLFKDLKIIFLTILNGWKSDQKI